MPCTPPKSLPPIAPPLPSGDGLFRVRLEDGRLAWLKRRRDRPVGFIQAEADGLRRLRAAGGLRVPRVLGLDGHTLLLEDLGRAEPAPDHAERAGAGLAVQHRVRDTTFGLERDGWCGDGFQDNTLEADGHRFFAERRLMAQARRARDHARLERADLARIERLCAHLPAWIPAQPPVLLHGDLWLGNLHCCADGGPALIDAGAVHFGWAEADLSMLVLFGTPPARLFDAYANGAPLLPDWRERAPLYNLYHLLNHLNLFGPGYLGAIHAVLRRFAPGP